MIDIRFPAIKLGRRETFMVRVNGQEIDAAGKNIEEMLLEQGFEKGRVAVERNEEIVSKATNKEVILSDGDVVEVVSFVGGG